MFLVVSFLIVCCQLIFQFLSTVLLVKAPIENKQNTSKQVKFESSHVRIIHKHRTRERGQNLSKMSYIRVKKYFYEIV